MSKKQYQAIAAIIGRQIRDAAYEPAAACKERREVLAGVSVLLADYFATDNPRFDRARFLAACGVEESK